MTVDDSIPQTKIGYKTTYPPDSYKGGVFPERYSLCVTPIVYLYMSTCSGRLDHQSIRFVPSYFEGKLIWPRIFLLNYYEPFFLFCNYDVASILYIPLITMQIIPPAFYFLISAESLFKFFRTRRSKLIHFIGVANTTRVINLSQTVNLGLQVFVFSIPLN